MKTILVSCLAHRHTGGLTLAHQLCAELVNQGFNAKMYYYFGCGQKKSNPVNPNYEKYGLSYVTKLEDNEETIIVVPETNVNILRKIYMDYDVLILNKKIFYISHNLTMQLIS